MANRVFLVNELMRQILDNFLPDFDVRTWFATDPDDRLPELVPSAEDRKTLLNVALTCHALKEGALDMLWWAMDDLTPLFRLLRGYRASEDRTLIIDSPVSEADRETFFRYAKKIKLYHQAEASRISSAAYFQVLGAANRSLIFPSLRYFICEWSSREIAYFASPTLRVFVARIQYLFQGEAPPVELWEFISTLTRNSEGLYGLDLVYPMSDTCLSSICKVRGLQYLRLNHVPLEMLTEDFVHVNSSDIQVLHRSSGTTLTSLCFEGVVGLTLAMTQPADTIYPFSNVKTLSISCSYNDMIQMTRLFRSTAFPSLERIELVLPARARINPGSEVVTWNEFFKSLVGSTTSRLRSFFVNKLGMAHPDIKVPLSQLPHLLKLHLSSFDMHALASVTVPEVHAMNEAWPHIEELHLLEPIGFDVLKELAISLPRLRLLEVNLDLTEYPAIDNIPILNHPLSTLEITTHKAFKDSFCLALCLDRLFPSLRYFPHPVTYSGDEWVKGFRLIKALQRVRADQEVRINAREAIQSK